MHNVYTGLALTSDNGGQTLGGHNDKDREVIQTKDLQVTAPVPAHDAQDLVHCHTPGGCSLDQHPTWVYYHLLLCLSQVSVVRSGF